MYCLLFSAAAAVFGFVGFNGGQTAPYLSNFTTDKGLFPNGAQAVLFTLVMVNFSFQGTELVGIASGESENPEKTLPRSIRNVIWRTLFFFVLTMFVLVSILPYQTAGVIESPFVAVLDKIGVPYAADIMNFVILTAMLSVANSGLYASSRMMWSLSKTKMGPASLTKLTKKGVPLKALFITIAISGLSLLTSVVAAETVYVWLISISGMITVVAWMSICASQFVFRRRFLAEGGNLKDLAFKTPLYPIVPILGFSVYGLILISLIFIPDQRIGLYCGVPLMIICYAYYHFGIKKRLKREPASSEKGSLPDKKKSPSLKAAGFTLFSVLTTAHRIERHRTENRKC